MTPEPTTEITPLTPSELAEMRQAHSLPFEVQGSVICAAHEPSEDWPCQTIRALAALAQKDAQIAELVEAANQLAAHSFFADMTLTDGSVVYGIPSHDHDALLLAASDLSAAASRHDAEQRAQERASVREAVIDTLDNLHPPEDWNPPFKTGFEDGVRFSKHRLLALLSDKEAATFRSLPCTECDGVGWTEGGPSLQTPCGRCHGTGDDPEEAPNAE